MSLSRLFAATAACFLAAGVSAEERILSLHSDITVLPGGQVEVTEVIKVRADGEQVDPGLYRDFVSNYKDRDGRDRTVLFEMIHVMRDGWPAHFHTETLSQGMRVHIEDKDTRLALGDHVYTITYIAHGQITNLASTDVLDWDVTGSWGLPIDRISANVLLPSAVQQDQVRGLGYIDATGERLPVGGTFSESGIIKFRTIDKLSPGEHMRVSLRWPNAQLQTMRASEN